MFPYAGEVELKCKVCTGSLPLCHLAELCPGVVQLLSQLLDDMVPEERKIGIQMGIRVLIACEELWLCGSLISTGMFYELKETERLGIPVRRVSGEEIMGHCKIRREFMPEESPIFYANLKRNRRNTHVHLSR